MNMAMPMDAVLFQRQGLARLKALLEEVSFVKTVKVLPQSKHDWDAELAVRTTAGATRLLVDCRRRSEPRFLREAAARFDLARIRHPRLGVEARRGRAFRRGLGFSLCFRRRDERVPRGPVSRPQRHRPQD